MTSFLLILLFLAVVALSWRAASKAVNRMDQRLAKAEQE